MANKKPTKFSCPDCKLYDSCKKGVDTAWLEKVYRLCTHYEPKVTNTDKSVNVFTPKTFNTKWSPIINEAVKKYLGIDVKLFSDGGFHLRDTLRTGIKKEKNSSKLFRTIIKNPELWGLVWKVDDSHLRITINLTYDETDKKSFTQTVLVLMLDSNGKVKKVTE